MKKGNHLLLALFIVLWTIPMLQQDLYAQSNSPVRLEKEQPGFNGSKASAGNRKKKSKKEQRITKILLQKEIKPNAIRRQYIAQSKTQRFYSNKREGREKSFASEIKVIQK